MQLTKFAIKHEIDTDGHNFTKIMRAEDGRVLITDLPLSRVDTDEKCAELFTNKPLDSGCPETNARLGGWNA